MWPSTPARQVSPAGHSLSELQSWKPPPKPPMPPPPIPPPPQVAAHVAVALPPPNVAQHTSLPLQFALDVHESDAPPMHIPVAAQVAVPPKETQHCWVVESQVVVPHVIVVDVPPPPPDEATLLPALAELVGPTVSPPLPRPLPGVVMPLAPLVFEPTVELPSPPLEELPPVPWSSVDDWVCPPHAATRRRENATLFASLMKASTPIRSCLLRSLASLRTNGP